MKSFILSITLCLVATCSVYSQEHNMTVVLTNTNTVDFPLNDLPTITFSDDQMIFSTSEYTIAYHIDEVDNYYFDNGISSIADTGISGDSYGRSGDEFTLRTMPSTPVNVYSIDGMSLLSTISDDTGTAKVSLDTYAPGIYIITFGKTSIKVIKL